MKMQAGRHCSASTSSAGTSKRPSGKQQAASMRVGRSPGLPCVALDASPQAFLAGACRQGQGRQRRRACSDQTSGACGAGHAAAPPTPPLASRRFSTASTPLATVAPACPSAGQSPERAEASKPLFNRAAASATAAVASRRARGMAEERQERGQGAEGAAAAGIQLRLKAVGAAGRGCSGECQALEMWRWRGSA